MPSDAAKASNDKLVIPCEVYSRIVGYLRPVQNWNEAKQVEFADRKVFKIPKEIDEKSAVVVRGKSG